MNPGGLQINNKNMEYVAAVAQYDSITAAAESLYISQPALSRFISNLEKRIGVTLFQRVGNRFLLTYEGEPIVAVFSSAAGEKTERAVDVWGSDIPYLQSVDSPGGEACPKYYDAVVLTADEICERAAKTLPSADLSGDPSGWFKASERSEAGGIVRMKFGGVEVKGTVMRTLLGLNSTNFTVKIDGNTLTFTTTGYGHGVGLSQWGAKHSAEQGQTYDEILAHYYPGTTLTTISTE